LRQIRSLVIPKDGIEEEDDEKGYIDFSEELYSEHAGIN
jgi:hypothetical protein